MESIRGSEQLIARFGRWPSFHDAEVLRLVLDRRAEHEDGAGPTLTADVYVFERSEHVDARGFLTLRNHTIATLAFYEVVQLELAGFNEQNALWALEIEDIRERGLERVRFSVRFSPSYGLSASFQCRAVEVLSARALESSLGEAAT